MKEFIYLFVMINPFSQVLYMWDFMRESDNATFRSAYWKASWLSFGVFAFFALTGEFLFVHVFQVRLDSFRIFGGIVILYVAFQYIHGKAGSNVLFRGNPLDLAPQISLPFMVGPGTIWVSILIGNHYEVEIGLIGIAIILLINFIFVVTVAKIIDRLEELQETMMGKYFALLMRTNALFVGAIAIEMIVSGIKGILFSRDIMP